MPGLCPALVRHAGRTRADAAWPDGRDSPPRDMGIVTKRDLTAAADSGAGTGGMKPSASEAGGQAVCTRVMWNDNGYGVIVGRNMDWLEDMGTNLWVLPRGAKRAGMDRDPNPLCWTARYGSVIASVHDYASADGINERGLAAQMLWLAESDYGPRDTSLPGLSLTLWAQFFLDKFTTVAECTDFMAGHPFQVRPATSPMRWPQPRRSVSPRRPERAAAAIQAGHFDLRLRGSMIAATSGCSNTQNSP
jgi:Linear amide C-N hydrolases, choloylglycine hydrolase family